MQAHALTRTACPAQLLAAISRLPRARQQADAEGEALLLDDLEQQELEEQQQEQDPEDAEQSFHRQQQQQQQELQARLVEALLPLLWQQLPDMGPRTLATLCFCLQRLGHWDHQLLQVGAGLPALLLAAASPAASSSSGRPASSDQAAEPSAPPADAGALPAFELIACRQPPTALWCWWRR
jgi:hypothetical protein